MDNTTEAAEVFQAKAEVHQIIEASSTTVRGEKVEVRVEMGQERKMVDNVFQPRAGH